MSGGQPGTSLVNSARHLSAAELNHVSRGSPVFDELQQRKRVVLRENGYPSDRHRLQFTFWHAVPWKARHHQRHDLTGTRWQCATKAD